MASNLSEITETGPIYQDLFSKIIDLNFLDGPKEEMLGRLSPPEDDEQEMLKRAIAMSLEEEKREQEKNEELFTNGELSKIGTYQITTN